MKKYIVTAVICLLFVLFTAYAQTNDVSSAKIIAIEVGDNFSFAVDADGNLWAWGNNEFGQLGDGTKTTREEGPNPYILDFFAGKIIDDNNRKRPVKITDNVVSVSAGYSHAMAVKTDGSLWAWGYDIFGEYGDEKYEFCFPIKIMDDVASVSTGANHTMIIKTDDSLWAWGRNSEGQLGNGTITTRDNNNDSYTPIKIMDSIASVSVGYSYTMAIQKDGSLWAWGWNCYGQLGNGGDGNETDSIGRPVQTIPVKIMDDVASVSAGNYHTMAIKSDESLWAWGWNYSGELGDGTASGRDDNFNIIDNNRNSPIKVMDSVVSVSAGRDHTMIIKTDGSLWAWGSNEHGLIGKASSSRPIGAAPARSAQLPIKIMDSIASISTGKHTLALKTDGSVWAWGYNDSGQLGDGTTKDRLSPVKILDGK